MVEDGGEDLIEGLNDLRDEVTKAKGIIRALVKKKETAWSDEMKRDLLTRVRSLHAEVKPLRDELKRLRGEVTNLTGTRDALEQVYLKGVKERQEVEKANRQSDDLFDSLEKLEDIADNKPRVDTKKFLNLEEMSDMSAYLVDAINVKKEELEPILDTTRYIREELTELSLEHQLAEKQHRRLIEETEKEQAILKKDIYRINKKIAKNDITFCICSMKVKKLKFERMFLREASAVPNALHLHPIGTFKDKILKKIREEEARKLSLEREHEMMVKNENESIIELKKWNNLDIILQVKKRAMNRIILEQNERNAMVFNDSASFSRQRDEEVQENDSFDDDL